MKFETWMNKINNIIKSKTGLCTSDIPDNAYAVNYEDGYTPKQMAKIVLDDLEQETLVLRDIILEIIDEEYLSTNR